MPVSDFRHRTPDNWPRCLVKIRTFWARFWARGLILSGRLQLEPARAQVNSPDVVGVPGIEAWWCPDAGDVMCRAVLIFYLPV